MLTDSYQLKPICVDLSQSALRYSSHKTDPDRISTILKQLLKTLENEPGASANNGNLDSKIAEYVFFPLSHILRQIESLPLRTVELTLQCIQIILRTGWREKVPPAIGIQLLILLTFLTDSNQPKSERYATSEELRSVALLCLERLFSSLAEEEEGRKALVDVSNVPTISHVISTLLDQANNGPSITVQEAALKALNAFVMTFPDVNALAAFLPGTISSLVKVLSTKAGTRRNYKVLVAALDVLCNLIARTLNDDIISRFKNSFKGKDKPDKPFGTAWLEAASDQMKLALSNVVKLKDHDRSEVQRSLLQLSKIVIERCRECLSSSRSMMLETLASIKAGNGNDLLTNGTSDDVVIDNDIADAFKDCLYSWLMSLPWTMQLKDDHAISELILRIVYAYKVTISHDDNLQMTDSVIITNIIDGITASTKADEKIQYVSGVTMEEMISTKSSAGSRMGIDMFEPVILRSGSQIRALDAMMRFLKVIGTSRPQILTELVRNVPVSQNKLDLASFWLCLNIVKAGGPEMDHIDAYLHMPEIESLGCKRILEELYYTSVDHIISLDANNLEDWRVTALALESISLQAVELREDFRHELIDCLYPILHLLGSPNAHVQKHAIITLNVIADACGYMHASDLIVSNVDYLVNAIALKLNTLDISPQAPQTLLMMIKLSGSSLLPYLDDLMENIFAVLDCYHHYPKLVELLFTVLSSVTEVGIETPQLAIDSTKSIHPRNWNHQSEDLTLPSITADLRIIAERKLDFLTNENNDRHTPFPRRPWKEEKGEDNSMLAGAENHDGEGAKDEEANADADGNMATNETEAGPPAPDIFNLLLRIARLTQHYLPSSLPTLRVSLLNLLLRVLPTLALHENSFLPLINAVWPVVRARLDDSEGYVVRGALDVISTMCKYAGEFMKSRMEELWEDLRKIYVRVVNGSKTSSQGQLLLEKGNQDLSHSLPVNILGSEHGSADKLDVGIEKSSISKNNDGLALSSKTSKNMNSYVETSARQIWESLIGLFVVMLEYVSVSSETFDDMLDLLGPVMETQSHVRAALEAYNADAVWLALLKRGRSKDKKSPEMHRSGTAPSSSDMDQHVFQFSNVHEVMSTRPADEHGWKFASFPGL